MESEQPELVTFAHPIFDDSGESTVSLTVTRYDNAIQAALYDGIPRLGSMTLVYPVGERIEQQSLFAGKHEQMSRALGMMLVRGVGNIVYASVNLSEHAQVTTETIRSLVQEYIESLA